MRVLVIGGYGFIGSAITEKLVKEKHKVTIIDDLSSGSQSNVKLRHNGVILDVTNPRCEKIFADNHFEVVIYASSHGDKVSNPTSIVNNSSSLVGLRNMLEISLKHEVKRFIYLSSYQVYQLGTEGLDETSLLKPADDTGRDYLYGENYCTDYVKKGMDINILRLSNVYGQRQHYNNANLPSIIGWNSVYGLKTICDSYVESFQDYIYVTDVADAVLKTIENAAPLYMNIGSGKKISSQHVSIAGDKFLKERGFEHEDIDMYKAWDKSFTLNTKLVYQSIGWFPITEFDDGFSKTMTWIALNGTGKKKKDGSTTDDEENLTLGQRIYPLVENVGIFLGFVLLSIFLKNVIQIQVDVMMIYVVLICLFYGLEQGTLSISLASIALIFFKLSEGSDVAYILFDLTNVFHIAMYVVIGTSIGYWVDKDKYEHILMKRDLEDVHKELEFVEGVYEKSVLIKNTLQSDIENYENSFGSVFDITEKLNKISTEEIYSEAVKIISNMMHAENVAIFYIGKKMRYARMMAYCGDQNRYDKSMLINDYFYLKPVVNEMKTYINTDLTIDAPMIASPVIYAKEAVALVLIDGVAFENLSLHYINTLKVVMMLLSNAIGSAKKYHDAVEEQRYFGQTQILKNEWFEKIASMRKNAEKGQLVSNYVLELDLPINEGIKNYEKLLSLTRTVDYIGETKDNMVAIMLSNASSRDRHIVQSRFEAQGFKLK